MISCTVTSKTRTDRYENLRAVSLPGVSGEFEVMDNHAEAFFILDKGNISLKFANGEEKKISIANGGCYVKDNSVLIFLISSEPEQNEDENVSSNPDYGDEDDDDSE